MALGYLNKKIKISFFVFKNLLTLVEQNKNQENMGTPKKPVKKPISKPIDDEDDDDFADDSTSKKKIVDDEDDDFDLPLDDIGGFDEIGFDDDDDF